MQPLVEVRELKKYFPIKGGFFKRTVGHIRAVDEVTFKLYPERTLGLVGESGCGKSTLGRTVLGLHPATGGSVVFEGRDITQAAGEQWRQLRRDMQIIFQDPYASLNPRRTVRQTIREPLDTHGIGTPEERNERVRELLGVVGLREQVIDRYPHEFSGGQRQRVGIARCLALNPKFIVADEPVSALDVSVQSQVLNLIKRLQREFGLAFLFISHDLAVVQHISHDVGVMYFGRLVELADAATLYASPKHPYTVSLLQAAPKPEPQSGRQRIVLEGDIPSHLDPPGGCPFHPRCPRATSVCAKYVPRFANAGDPAQPQVVSCHLYRSSQPELDKVPAEDRQVFDEMARNSGGPVLSPTKRFRQLRGNPEG